MKQLALAGLTILCLSPAPAFAQAVFSGTWKADLATVKITQKPDSYLLQNNIYSCITCVPAIQVPADGTAHAVSGHPYFDAVAIKVLNPSSIQEADLKAGKVVNRTIFTAGPDGKILTIGFSDSSNSSAAAVTGKVTATRVSAAPAGANAISGTWRTASYANVSDNGLTVTYRLANDRPGSAFPDRLVMTTPTGQSYNATVDETDCPFHGDPGVTTVSLKSLSENTLQETDKLNGKIVAVTIMTVAADAMTMEVTYSDKIHGRIVTYTADIQQ